MDGSSEALNKEVGDEVHLVPGQNWVALNGMFTPSRLREIADIIEESYSKVPKRGSTE
jgi:hypothetical protein